LADARMAADAAVEGARMAADAAVAAEARAAAWLGRVAAGVPQAWHPHYGPQA